MSDPRSVLERESRRFIQADGAFERLQRRRDRKRRNQRVAAGVLGIAVFAFAAIGFIRLLGSQTTVDPATTENGQAVGEPYSILDGEVTFAAAPPWEVGFAGPWALWLDDNFDERVHVVAEPLPIEAGCQPGPAPADAETLAQSIRSDPDLEATEPVAVGVGGIEALRMDVVAATGASVCPDWEGPGVVRETGVEDVDATVVLGGEHRMRLYLLDLPGGSARILAIAIVAPEPRFERVVDAAAPILDSFEFRTR